MRDCLRRSEIVRKEYLGHKTHMQMSNQMSTIKGERIKTILDVTIKFQTLLTKKIQALAPVYEVDNEEPWFKKLLFGDALTHKGQLTATLPPGYTIGNAIFRDTGLQKCPCTCTCNVDATEEYKDGKKAKAAAAEGTKGWGKIKKAGVGMSQENSMQCILVSRRNFLMARSAEPMRFLKTLPYFSDELRDDQLLTVAESMTIRSLAMNSHLVRRGEKADQVFLVKAGQLKILLQAGTKHGDNPDTVYHVHDRKDTYDAAIVGAGDAIEEAEPGPDGQMVYGADIVATSSGVVLYSVPVGVFQRFANWREVSRHRNALRKEYLGDQTQLKPVQVML